MNILVVSATEFEVKPLLGFLGIALPTIGINKANIDFEEKDIKVLITGVGMVNTALMMGRYAHTDYDLIINSGVCGAFDKQLELGELVHITEDVLSELGAEDGDGFLTYNQMNLPGEHIYTGIYKDSYLMVELLKKVKGITVNTVHGNDVSIEKVKQLYHPDVESMEGAAFFAACSGMKGNSVQIRAISNYVEKRDKDKWQMPLAIKNLNDFLITFIKNV
ncbi:MAG: futalosine hydrolase [Bacteroidetes bacterium]|nr:futalosine hydrolase [Bacteroidota bacterium]